jgi:protein arginine kinase activator
MLCDICGKKQATVHLTEIVDDQMTELHLCESCARDKSIQMEQHFGIADLLAGLADLGEKLDVAPDIGAKCSNCGMTYKDFKKIGRFGCSDCYEAFKENLAPLLKRIHGSSQHVGRLPIRAKKVTKFRSELQELRARLQRAIQMEEFEEAASLRDKIRELEKAQKQQESRNKKKKKAGPQQ